MRGIYLEVLTTGKDQKNFSYEKIYQRTGISISKLQCIFTGQRTFTVVDFELICEKGLDLDLDEIYARFGRQEFRDSQDVDYKGAKEELDVYEMYNDFSEAISKIADHRILAINRGEKEKFLKVKLEKPDEKIIEYISRDVIKGNTVFTDILNTAIEAVVDLVTLEEHPLAKIAKDCGSAATFVLAVMAAAIGCFVYIPYIPTILKGLGIL